MTTMNRNDYFTTISTLIASSALDEGMKTALMTKTASLKLAVTDAVETAGDEKMERQAQYEGVRTQIIGLLADGERTCGEIADALGVMSQTIVYAIKPLVADGTVTKSTFHGVTVYSI